MNGFEIQFKLDWRGLESEAKGCVREGIEATRKGRSVNKPTTGRR